MSTPQNDIDALLQISTDPALCELGQHVPELSLLRLVGRARSELTHSGVIAQLLDPRRHRQAEPALRGLLAAIERELTPADAPALASYRRVASSAWTAIRVQRELFRIDIVVEIVSDAGCLVLGIENKIDAGEQPEQVARYQHSLAQAYPFKTLLLVFLAPQKRTPTTADPLSPVPVVAMDYSAIVAAVQSARDATPSNTSDFFVLGEIARHLREDLLEDNRVRDLARQLWRDHPRALELAMEHRPRLSDIQNDYERRVRERLGEDALLTHHPTRGSVREIKLRLKSWVRAGLPFDFILYADAGESPSIRVLLWSAAFDERKPSLLAWAKHANERVPNLVDETFAPIANWNCWRRVLVENEYPEGATIQATQFDAETLREAENRLFALIELLRPLVPSGA